MVHVKVGRVGRVKRVVSDFPHCNFGRALKSSFTSVLGELF